MKRPAVAPRILPIGEGRHTGGEFADRILLLSGGIHQDIVLLRASNGNIKTSGEGQSNSQNSQAAAETMPTRTEPKALGSPAHGEY